MKTKRARNKSEVGAGYIWKEAVNPFKVRGMIAETTAQTPHSKSVLLEQGIIYFLNSMVLFFTIYNSANHLIKKRANFKFITFGI
jgi:hypothetical protein